MILKVVCPECGESPNLNADEVTLYIKDSFYRFTCPLCNSWVAKNADERIAALLVASGVIVVHEKLKLPYPEAIPEGLTPMSLDDIIDLYADMDDGLTEAD
jgi:hypothetical protein